MKYEYGVKKYEEDPVEELIPMDESYEETNDLIAVFEAAIEFVKTHPNAAISKDEPLEIIIDSGDERTEGWEKFRKFYAYS